MVDPKKVRALLGRMGDRIRELDRYAETEAADYVRDPQAIAASKYLLLNVIEDALAAANHVIASEGYRSPGDYADSFRVLRERSILDRELADRLADMARFRNLLVHEYAVIDDERVHAILRERLGDLESFAGAVLDAFPELGSAPG